MGFRANLLQSDIDRCIEIPAVFILSNRKDQELLKGCGVKIDHLFDEEGYWVQGLISIYESEFSCLDKKIKEDIERNPREYSYNYLDILNDVEKKIKEDGVARFIVE